MKKDIYKELPEAFHRQFNETLAGLEECSGETKRGHKRYGLILAAAVLACASVTAAAAGLMGWHESLSDRFGTEKELEDKLTMEHVAIPQKATAEGGGLKFQALQAVRTDTYGAFLLEVTVPEGIEWNEDIMFETCEVVGREYSCTYGFVEDSFADGKVLLELQVLYYEEKVPVGEEIHVILKNLVQTEKTQTVACLTEGEWEIALSMPSEADILRYYPEEAILLGGHELHFEQVDISPFRIRLYAQKEEALHAVWGHSVSLTGVEYADGTIVQESGMQFSMSGHMDEADAFCFETALDRAVDPDKITALAVQDDGLQKKISLDRRECARQAAGMDADRDADNVTDRNTGNATYGNAGNIADKSADSIDLCAGIKGDGKIADVRLLYVRYDNVVFEAGEAVWLWDARCGGCRQLVSLEEYGFSWEKGAKIGVWNDQIQILPCADSEELYLYTIPERGMETLEAADFWPWPTYETYQERCRDVKEIVPEADERYGLQAHFAQRGEETVWYYLYSEDGSIKNMELRAAPVS